MFRIIPKNATLANFMAGLETRPCGMGMEVVVNEA
jgi:hypothetical protein